MTPLPSRGSEEFREFRVGRVREALRELPSLKGLREGELYEAARVALEAADQDVPPVRERDGHA